MRALLLVMDTWPVSSEVVYSVEEDCVIDIRYRGVFQVVDRLGPHAPDSGQSHNLVRTEALLCPDRVFAGEGAAAEVLQQSCELVTMWTERIQTVFLNDIRREEMRDLRSDAPAEQLTALQISIAYVQN